MITLQPLTVSQYFDLEDKSDYNFAMKYAFKFTDPVDEYKVGDLMEFSVGFIKDFQFDFEHGLSFDKLIDYVLLATKKRSVGKEALERVTRFMNYLKAGIDNIIEAERAALAYDATENEESAGIDRFKDLGIYLQIRSVAIALHMSPEQVRKMKYVDFFVELYTQKQLSEYDRDLKRIQDEQNRPKKK